MALGTRGKAEHVDADEGSWEDVVMKASVEVLF